MAKCVFWVTIQEAKATCGTEPLEGGFEAGIKGEIHTMRLLWAQHSHDEYRFFLLIDTWNTFNEENLMAIL